MAPDPSFRGRTVLVVEGSAMIALDLDQAVAALGCAVLGPVGRVPQAMRLLEGGLPDAALLDVQLDPGTAVPLAELLRARGVPYAAVTGYHRQDLVEALWQGVPYLTKPFTIGQVQALLLPAQC